MRRSLIVTVVPRNVVHTIIIVMLCTYRYNLHNLKNVKNTHRGVKGNEHEFLVAEVVI